MNNEIDINQSLNTKQVQVDRVFNQSFFSIFKNKKVIIALSFFIFSLLLLVILNFVSKDSSNKQTGSAVDKVITDEGANDFIKTDGMQISEDKVIIPEVNINVPVHLFIYLNDKNNVDRKIGNSDKLNAGKNVNVEITLSENLVRGSDYYITIGEAEGPSYELYGVTKEIKNAEGEVIATPLNF